MGTTSEKLTYLNATKTLIKEELNLGGANISNEPFRVYSSKLIDIYKDFLANGTDTLWNNWEKVSGSGESLTLNNTIKAKMKIDLKGNTSQEGTPTPDDPIPVQVVSGDNSINIHGKNLFDGELELGSYNGETGDKKTANDNYRNKNIIKVKPNTTYTFSINGVSQKYVLFYYTSTQNFIRTTTGLTTGTFTTPNNCYYINFRCFASDFTSDFANLKIQLEKGSKATDFMPYQSASYSVNLGSLELCKIGEYQDRIYKDSGKWYVHKEIGKVVLDGSESTLTTHQFGTNSYQVKISNSGSGGSIITAISNSFLGIPYNDRSSAGSNVIYTDTNTLVNTVIRNTSYTSLDDFKTWLSTHNTTVYYVLATPTITEITDTTLISQLEAIKKSYNNQTSISQVNNDLPFELDVVALGELEII